MHAAQIDTRHRGDARRTGQSAKFVPFDTAVAADASDSALNSELRGSESEPLKKHDDLKVPTYHDENHRSANSEAIGVVLIGVALSDVDKSERNGMLCAFFGLWMDESERTTLR